ncbi:glycosyltransferase family 2 protein [Actomonas aquatica]|uniref:Glycosyltransferase n=1 Tax=Actomonas aquatica TaxID=2866162 RepID=A0ABZ1CAQ1_9BACT|nr:glycosyltransferase [Opitutus sp. WL0086]WRQ88460.1 glycosyltransferase [Opitutus sp. WL0086]
MSRPTLALCIPAYRAAWCLPRLLGSAARQGIPFDEILVYNDCSPDNTAEVAQAHGATVVDGKVNVGCSAGKNALLNVATSEWIHFHDADDELLPNFTQLAHAWMARGADCPDVVLFAYEYRDNENQTLLATRYFEADALRHDAVDYAIREQINPFCGLYRRDRVAGVGGYDTAPEILFNEDVAFHCKLAVAGLNFDAESAVSIINYRVGGSMSGSNQLRCIQAHVEVMRRLIPQVGKSHGAAIASRTWHAAGILAMHGKWDEADAAIALGRSVYPKPPDAINRTFAILCQLIGPERAFRLREGFIRRFKPHLRSSLDKQTSPSASP